MDARHRDVLIAVIREYIDSAEPVGSRVLSKRHFPSLSPATIRNAMADLEDMGYLVQPHTSAGRGGGHPRGQGSGGSCSRPRPPRRSGLEGFMERTSSHLSTVTKLTGLLLAPPLQQTTLARVDLMPLEEDRARAVTEQIVSLLRGRTLYVSGAINMLDHPEFWDIEATRELLRTFEQKERLPGLTTPPAADDELRVTIGGENPYAEMRECTLITSTYLYRDQVIGILGVVGPRRLPYPEVISVVNETARHVTEALSPL